jgi:nucleotidyltransferase substrate binding protein (TIGR01987 family)
MAPLSDILDSAERALQTLDEVLAQPYSVFIRDASIQRFEYTFEAVWKLLKAHLLDVEGVVCSSPKACFRQALPAGLLDESEVLLALEMTDDRNRTVHTYHEALADKIFAQIAAYRDLMRQLCGMIARTV